MNSKRAEEYRAWLEALNRRSATAEGLVRQKLNEYIDNWLMENSGNEQAAFCSSWIPGLDWEKNGGVYQPLYNTMLGLYGDERTSFERAGWFFGLLLLDIVETRERENGEEWEKWHLPRQPDEEPLGMFYRPKTRTTA